MTNIHELEKKWRAAAETQAEAKREFDATVRQMQGTGVQVANEPAVRIAASNLAKAVTAWRAALDSFSRRNRGTCERRVGGLSL